MMGNESPRSDASIRLGRIEQDISELKSDLKAGLREVNTSLSGLQSQFNGLQVTLPLTYVTRVDLTERLHNLEEACKQRDESNQRQIKDVEGTLRQLTFAIIGALITGGLALLAEVFRLLSGKPG